MAFSLKTLAHAIATPSNSASQPIFNSNPSLPSSPQLVRLGLRSSFDFSCHLAKQSMVSILQQPADSFADFGKYGGKYVPEKLMSALTELESAFNALQTDHEFQKEFDEILSPYKCTESPLSFAKRLTEYFKPSNGEGPEIYLKREYINGYKVSSHKIHNALAQTFLAKKLGKKRIILEIGTTGEVGVATACACAKYGLQCIVYVRIVHSDTTLEAIRDWVTNPETTHYIIGLVAGPHPYPMMVREFHSVVGKEIRKQAMKEWGGKPDVIVTFVGDGSNAMGLFHEFVEDKEVRLIGAEAEGILLDIAKHTTNSKHATNLTKGEVRELHGAMTYLLQDDGQLVDLLSVSAGLGLSGVGPKHNSMKDLGRAEYYSTTDMEAFEAFKRFPNLGSMVGVGLETSHALAYLEKLCPTLANGTKVVVNCSGRGEDEYSIFHF